MLVLKRKAGESLVIADNIEIKIIEVVDGRVKIGIEAPKSISVMRKEVIEEISSENKEASAAKVIDKESLKKLLKK